MICPTCHAADSRPFFGGVMDRCPSCSFLFVSSPERERQQKAFIDNEIYDEAMVERSMQKYPRTGHTKRELYRRTALRLAGLHEKHIEALRIADLGASGGFFLYEFEKFSARSENFLAVEMSPNYIELTKRYFGYPTLRGNIEDMPAKNPFDIVTMFDVLEHINDVPAAMHRIHTQLIDGGLLYLKLPNGAWARFKSLIPRVLGMKNKVERQLYLEPGGHLNYWNPHNIHFFERYGFSLVETGFVEPTRLQFKNRFFFYILWFRLHRLLHINLYPEFYAIFRK